MQSPVRLSSLVVASLLAVGAAGCGSKFDKSSEIKSLRVLAVQKDLPYAKPGTPVNLRILMWDGKSPVDGPRREVQTVWFGGCEDPAGDLYYGCFEQLASKFSAFQTQGAPTADLAKYVHQGSSFTWTLSDDIIDRRPAEPGAVAPYGLSYVFFAACAGRLGAAPPRDDAPFPLPIACLDPNGQPLGPDDFVPGFSAIYSYESITNANPIVRGLNLDDVGMPAWADDAPAPDGVPHVPRCTGGDCTHELLVDVDRASVEQDPGATTPDGAPLSEQLWVDYYATAGDVQKPARLVNDATTGWNADQTTEWTAPEEPGPVVVWAVVHDNRGGVEWFRSRIIVD